MSADRLSEIVRLVTAGAAARDEGRLDDAIGAFLDAYAAGPPDAPWRESLAEVYAGVLDQEEAAAQSALSVVFAMLHEATLDPALFDQALARARAAVAADGAEFRVRCLANLSQLAHRRYEVSGDPAALAEALDAARRALDALPGHVRLRHDYAVMLRSAYLRDGLVETLEENCALLAGVVADVPDEPLYLVSWATSLMERHHVTGELADLETAAGAAEKAVAGVDPADPRLAAYLNVAGAALFELGKAASDEAKLRRALEYGRACVAATPPGAPERAAHLSNLAAHLGLLPDAELLREAVVTLQEAFGLLPDGHPARADVLGRMTECLFALYDQTGEARLLDEAEATGRETVALLPPGSPVLGAVLNTLSVVLRTKNRFAEAVEMGRRAVAQPGDAPGLAVHLDSLRHCLSRHDDALGGDAGVRREIVEVARRTVELSPGHARRLSSLSWALLQAGDLDEAVETGRRAAASSADAEIAFRAGCALLGRATEADAREAVEILTRGARDEGSAPQHRIEAYRALAYAHAGLGDHPAALDAMDRAVALFPAVAPWRLAREGRTRALGRHGELASEAAAAALDAGDPGRALTYLEQARVLLLGEALRMRSDLHDLDPGDAAEFLRIRDLLTAETEEKPGHLPLLDSSGERLRLSRAFDDLLARIRRDHPGFLVPPRLDGLLAQAAEGPIVLVSASAWRGDALIATPEGVRHVPLPGLRHDDAVRWARGLDADSAPANTFLFPLLSWLWDTVAGPVLAALDPAPGSRLWWCPAGALASLPLHAAGRHLEGGPRVGDRVVSSYTATVRALGHARTRRPGVGGALIVAVPEADGHVPLPGTVRELEKVAGHLGRAGIPVGTPTRAAAILEALPASSVVHVAAHASADAQPWNGGVQLAGERLTVGEIARLDLSGAGLAYLSACETGVTRLGLADEAVHLAGAFQVAGFPQVVGSLWQVKDRIAARVADRVYDTALPDLGRVPHALHAAVERIREDYPSSPALWAAFTHHGR
ncbi:CHAT domain-containing protein [Herbidospora daliensis]|uniref:CHAT domain-containing protein n=1 Tax=Herbidospora daliensis TaxID=295585 RepID=UPI000B17D0EC|nr:CHAT domain-containing protein [Herbidospora daliensis]